MSRFALFVLLCNNESTLAMGKSVSSIGECQYGKGSKNLGSPEFCEYCQYCQKLCQNRKDGKKIIQKSLTACLIRVEQMTKDHRWERNDALVNTSNLAWLYTGDVEEGETRGFLTCEESVMTKFDSMAELGNINLCVR